MKKFIALSVLLVISLSSCRIYRDVDMRGLPFVPTAKDFGTSYEIPIGSTSEYESNSLINFADDTYIFEYNFDNTESEEAVVSIFYQYMVEKEATGDEAWAMLMENKNSYIESFEKQGFEIRPIQGLNLSWPKHYCGEFAFPEGRVVGTLLVATKGNMVITIYINADRQDYPGLVEQFFNSYLQKTKVEEGRSSNSYNRVI